MLNSKRALILTMGALVLIGFGIASLYYQNENSKVDPRTIEARELYKKYDSYAEENNFAGVLKLLDSVELVYNRYPHYKNSYETGVLQNNRAATYLTMAIHFEDNSISLDGINTLSKDSLLILAEKNVRKGIHTYETWLDKFGSLKTEQIKDAISDTFFLKFDAGSDGSKEKYLEKRIEEIELAQLETKRRLSVAYTNLGAIYRHREEYKLAIEQYEKALELWDRNMAAKNNKNIMLGRPVEKQNFIQKLFPPDRKKE